MPHPAFAPLVRFPVAAACSLAALVIAAPALAQSAPPAAPAPTAATSAATRAAAGRPTVGLALGGGAARGIAHIGVLEWLEANRIPVDYIAGTSMGGLVAGAYAAGMSPDEIRQLMREVDWDNMFLADSPYKFKTFRRREDSRLFPSQLKFGLKGGFKGPSGINPGQRIQWLLNRIALPYGTLASFDELPTPFRCVATDINNAEPVVLASGSLSTAMRATMAIPAVFTPVRIGDRLLVDGGALNNVPVDVVRAMGADIVIAVDVAADIDTENEPQTELSLLGVVGKTIDAMMTPPVRRALADATHVVDPDLRGLNSLDWRRSDDLADRGFAAARAVESQLVRYRLDDAAWKAHVAERARRTPTRTPTLAFVRAAGVSDTDEALILDVVAARPGAPVDLAALEDSLAHLTGNDRYDTVGYRLEYENGQPGLVLDVAPKNYAPPFLFLAFDLQNVNSTSFSADARVRGVFTDLLNPGSELRTDFTIGTNQFAGVELFVPLGKSQLFATLGGARVFVAPRASFDRRIVNGYVDSELVAEYRFKRTGAGLDVGFTSGRRSEVRLGYDVRDVRGRRRVGDPILPEAEGTDRFASLRWVFDGQNSPLVPTRGLYVRGSLTRFFASAQANASDGAEPRVAEPNRFWQGDVRATWLQRVRGRDRLMLFGGGGSSFGDTPAVNAFSLGGPLRLSSFSRDEVRGPNYVHAGGGYLKRMFRLPDFLGSDVLAGGWLETGSAFDRARDADVEWSATGGVIIESLLGPVFGGISSGSNGGLKFYVALGPLFR